MGNDVRLGDILDKLTPSDRLVIYNAARQVVYRGFAANAMHSGLNERRRWQQVKRFWNCGRQNRNAKHRSGCWYT